ncbi:hypothetical protein K470DRAFT_263554 [Piedraia hortae CBS 480.64]|uniref:Uncharacterized protein n=1 Tax=Piedraia hortae CBS 480.64 TaxID=1314780 RepID=A0A6A7C331_9PEZI|nr:hypothetical protein K470DRAFT_263554 [Piedraia hortae CBS 480.64]
MEGELEVGFGGDEIAAEFLDRGEIVDCCGAFEGVLGRGWGGVEKKLEERFGKREFVGAEAETAEFVHGVGGHVVGWAKRGLEYGEGALLNAFGFEEIVLLFEDVAEAKDGVPFVHVVGSVGFGIDVDEALEGFDVVVEYGLRLGKPALSLQGAAKPAA